MTEKEERFCLAYPGEAKFNGTRAAEIAGFTGDNTTLSSTAHALLEKPEIKEEIKKQTERRLKDAGYQVDAVVAELLNIAFYDITDFQDDVGALDLTRKGLPTSAIQEITQKVLMGESGESKAVKQVKIKFHDKIKALEMLSKLLDMKSGTTPIELINSEHAKEKVLKALREKEETEENE